MTTTVAPLSPPLKWAGGKRWLLPVLQQLWRRHRHRRLVEPFCGGLSVALGLQPSEALLNDVNNALINFYQQLQQGLTVSIPFNNEEEQYYRYRRWFNELNMANDAPQHSAQLFYYLNRTGYNGLCRFNQSGKYNVPFGRYKTIRYQQDFLAYQTLLQPWQFTDCDFEQLKVSEEDFIYADPPYDVPFQQYAQQGFNWEDQERLALWLARHKGPVVISNQATTRIKRLYKQLGFQYRLIDAPRRISCKGNGRQTTKEVLIKRGI